MKRVKRPHGLLPKVPERGEKITVVLPVVGAVRAVVRRATGGKKIEHRVRGTFSVGTVSSRGGTVHRRDEGLTWARGWDTLAADALRVAVGL